MSSALKFLFFICFITTQKKKIILEEKQIVKRKIYVKSVLLLLLFWFAKNEGHSGPYNKKLSCLHLLHILHLGKAVFVRKFYIHLKVTSTTKLYLTKGTLDI